ncbi:MULTISPECIES: ATP-binding protein [Streptomyces]|uniref:ATP-binding protein n=1 Tax=Streptomyces TaxID=1883 RepID=UPI001F1EE523|nr:ATP-binding protein [Streptomyces sp. MOE7]
MTQVAEMPASAAEARDHVHALMAACPRPFGEVAQTDALLIISELVTNAQRHGGGMTGFWARVTDDHFDVTVEDASPAHPTLPGERPVGSVGGYGWPLVRRLATSVAVTPTARGKSIHVALRLR